MRNWWWWWFWNAQAFRTSEKREKVNERMRGLRIVELVQEFREQFSNETFTSKRLSLSLGVCVWAFFVVEMMTTTTTTTFTNITMAWLFSHFEMRGSLKEMKIFEILSIHSTFIVAVASPLLMLRPSDRYLLPTPLPPPPRRHCYHRWLGPKMKHIIQTRCI